jgi:hypothetical protein
VNVCAPASPLQVPLDVVAGAEGATLLVWGVAPEDLVLPPARWGSRGAGWGRG